MNDVERWIEDEGPEPRGIDELLEAARRDRRLTPARSARMKRNIDATLAARRRGSSRARPAIWAAAAAAAVLVAAAATFVVTVAVPAVRIAVRATTEGATLPTAPMMMGPSLPTPGTAVPSMADAGAAGAPTAPRLP